jgi:hypothetical protein
MRIAGGKGSAVTGSQGTINWEDQPSSVDNTIIAVNGQGFWEATRAYTQEIAALWKPSLDNSITGGSQTYSFIFERIKGFVTTPGGLSALVKGSLDFINCYFTSISNISSINSTYIRLSTHQASTSFNNTNFPTTVLTNTISSFGELSINGGLINNVNYNAETLTRINKINILNLSACTSIIFRLPITSTYSPSTQDCGVGNAFRIVIDNCSALTTCNLTTGDTRLTSLSGPFKTRIEIQNNASLGGTFSTNPPSNTCFLFLNKNNFTGITCNFPSNNSITNVQFFENKVESISATIVNSVGITNLNVRNNYLANLPQLPMSIETLDVRENGHLTNNNLVITGLCTTLPNQLKTLSLGNTGTNKFTSYNRNCKFTDYFTTGTTLNPKRPLNYLSSTLLETFTAPQCGITEIRLPFPSSIRTIDLFNSQSAADTPAGQEAAGLNNISTFDLSLCPTVTTLRLNRNIFLTSITNLTAATNIQGINLSNTRPTNMQSIVGNALGFSNNKSILSLSLNSLYTTNLPGLSNFSFSGLTGNGVTISFTQSGLNSATIDSIIINLYNNYFNTTTNTRTVSLWTINFDNTTSAANSNSNCFRTGLSLTALNALTNTSTAGAWTINFCGGGAPCRTTGC